MPTPKKPLKKKKTEVIVIAKPVKPFDLSEKPTDAEQQRQIGALKSLQVSEGWMLLRMTLDLQIKDIDTQIIAKQDHSGNQLSDADCDKLREQRAVMQGLVDKPELLLWNLERVDEEEPDDDPYEGSREFHPSRG